MMTFNVRGNLTEQPKALAGARPGYQLRIASDRPTATPDGERGFVTEFFTVAVFGDTAAKFTGAGKGDRVELAGTVRPNSYDKDGVTVHSYQLVGRQGSWTSIDDVRAARQAAHTAAPSADRTAAAAR